MSTSEQKIEIVTEWLVRQATARRLTNAIEVAQYAGLILAEKGYRTDGSSEPLSRPEVFEALQVIAERSYQADGFLLPAVVVHFADRKPSRHFYEWATELGLDTGDTDTGEFHAEQLDKVFAHYGSPVPNDASSLA